MHHRVIVIGGGVAGLSAAHRLVELKAEKNLSLGIVLLEAGNKLGGVISTKRTDGFLVEEGPDSFIITKPWALDLCRRVGIESQLIPTEDENRRAFVVRRDKLLPVPDGFFMLAPTQFLPFLTSPLFSWRGKFRMLMDLILPRAPGRADESLTSFVVRRLGREALERAAQPLIGGIYTADPEKLSLRATMPRFLEMEERHGSIIRAMLHEQRAVGKQQSGARYSLFVSFEKGMQTLVDVLSSCIPEGAVKLNQEVKRIEIKDGAWSVLIEGDNRLDADGIIMAIPAYRAAALVEGFDSSLAADLLEIEYVSSAVVNLAYKRESVSHRLDGFGFVVPAVENRAIIACSFSSVKFAGRAPEGSVLLRCFVGGAIQPEIYDKYDSQLIESAHKEVSSLLGIKSQPLFAMIRRYPKSMPQYMVGHLEHIAGINEKAGKYRGLALAGNAYSGVGIPDCVHSGESAAEYVLQSLIQPAG